MNQNAGLAAIKERHDGFFALAQQFGPSLVDPRAGNGLTLKAIHELVRDLRNVASTVRNLDEYKWVSDALLKWHVVVTNVLDESIDTRMAAPPEFLAAPAPVGRTALTEDEVESWLCSLAKFRDAYRKAVLNRAGSSEELKEDTDISKYFFALDIIEGRINFAGRIAEDAYQILEDIWIKDVKNLLAYLVWRERSDNQKPGSMIDDYYEAVRHIRELLVTTGIKAGRHEFFPVQQYLEEKYLSNGLNYDTRSGARELVRRKAARIYNTTQNPDDHANWSQAETYCKLFYNNIIAASIRGDTEATLCVLKAFQFSKAPEHGYHIITAFEIILAIYFLDPSIVASLWKNSELQSKPPASATSAVAVDVWPGGFCVPGSCDGVFFYTGRDIIFRGVMTNAQRADLEAATSDRERGYIRRLFVESRLIHESTTL